MTTNIDDIMKNLVKLKIYDLGQPYFNDMPVHPEDPPFLFTILKHHSETRKKFEKIAPGFSYSLELVVTSMHSGTHVDALAHMARYMKLFNDVPVEEAFSPRGVIKYSAEEIPIFLTKAVLADIAKFKGFDILPEKYQITPDDIENTLKWENVRLEKGNALLIRTGFSRYFTNDPIKYINEYAGINEESARWIIEKKVSVLGIDNNTISPNKPLDIHLMFYVDAGIHIIKNMNLEQLSHDNRYELILIAIPLKIVGATASLIRPIALTT